MALLMLMLRHPCGARRASTTATTALYFSAVIDLALRWTKHSRFTAFLRMRRGEERGSLLSAGILENVLLLLQLTRVCSAHFREDDFQKTTSIGSKCHVRRLVSTAVPSVFVWNDFRRKPISSSSCSYPRRSCGVCSTKTGRGEQKGIVGSPAGKGRVRMPHL